MGVTFSWSNSHAGRESHQQGGVLGSALHLLITSTAELWLLPWITEVQGTQRTNRLFLPRSNSMCFMAVGQSWSIAPWWVSYSTVPGCGQRITESGIWAENEETEAWKNKE